MTSQKNNPSVVTLAVGLLLSALSTHALADGSDPLTLTLSESITRDSNLTKTTEPSNDVSSQTDVRLRLDKPYGRQSYLASGRFGVARYQNNKQFNNQNYDVNGTVASEFGSNWSAALDGSASQNLVNGGTGPESTRFEKNLLNTRNVGLTVRYGVLGRWSLIGSVSTDHLSYSSDSQKYQNRDQTSQGLRVMYSPSDLLNFSLGASQNESKYPNLSVRTAPNGGEEVDQQSVDLGTNWQVTGFSALNAAVSFSKNKYKSDASANYSAVTSRINWNFTPRGAMTYNLAFSRSTDSDGSQTNSRTGLAAPTFVAGGRDAVINLPVNMVLNNVTTALNGTARWGATSKIGVTLGAAYYHFDVKRKLALQQSELDAISQVVDGSASSSSNYSQLSLGSDYQFSRAIAFNCNVQRYKQTVDLTRIAYDGNAVGCSASFTIN